MLSKNLSYKHNFQKNNHNCLMNILCIFNRPGYLRPVGSHIFIVKIKNTIDTDILFAFCK